jgi:hypothetical protein
MTVAPRSSVARIARSALAPLVTFPRSTKSVPTARAATPTSGHRARSARLTMWPPNVRNKIKMSAVDR